MNSTVFIRRNTVPTSSLNMNKTIICIRIVMFKLYQIFAHNVIISFVIIKDNNKIRDRIDCDVC